MRKGVGVAGFLFFILFFLNNYAHSAVTHKVKSGDRLHKTSSKYRVPVDNLRETNDLKTTVPRPGHTLTAKQKAGKTKTTQSRKATAKDSRRAAAVQEAVSEEEDNNEYIEYRLKSGDTLDQLARKFNIDREEIIDLNKARRKRLAPGTVVFIPKAEEDTEEAPTVLIDRPLKAWKNDEERGILVKVARSFDGAPYRYGGDTVRGLDCSAFVKKMYEIFEVQLPRSAREQYCAGPRVDKEELATGDLVFFKTKRYAKYPTHVGIYIGDDEFIHASSTLKRGVKVDCLTDSYFSRTYVGAVRVKAPPGAEKTETDKGSRKASSSPG